MTPLEEAVGLQRDWGRAGCSSSPSRGGATLADLVDDWLRRIEAFYNLGSRIIEVPHRPRHDAHARAGASIRPSSAALMREVGARRMVIMTHVGDPDTWYHGKYADAAKVRHARRALPHVGRRC